jgi:hypothetical protein
MPARRTTSVKWKKNMLVKEHAVVGSRNAFGWNEDNSNDNGVICSRCEAYFPESIINHNNECECCLGTANEINCCECLSEYRHCWRPECFAVCANDDCFNTMSFEKVVDQAVLDWRFNWCQPCLDKVATKLCFGCTKTKTLREFRSGCNGRCQSCQQRYQYKRNQEAKRRAALSPEQLETEDKARRERRAQAKQDYELELKRQKLKRQADLMTPPGPVTYRSVRHCPSKPQWFVYQYL